MNYILTVVLLFFCLMSQAQVSELVDIKSTTLAGAGDRNVVADQNGLLKIGSSILPSNPSSGDMIYYDGTTWQSLPIGTQGQTLTVCNNMLTWGPCNTVPLNANLLFASGFEGEVTLANPSQGYQRLNGVGDSGYEWNETLNGLWGSSNNGIHLINDAGIDNELQTVLGHTGENTEALYQEIAFSNGSPRAQTPYQINNIENDPDEYYISYWIKIDDTSLDEDDQWRIIWQYKTDRFDYEHPDPGYRIGIYIYTDEDGPYWHVKGDDQNPDYWSVSDRDTPVPRDEWFKVEVYSKISAGNDGRFWAKINGVEIASQDGPNLGSEDDSMKFMMLWQLYGNSTPAHQWIDDVEIWDGYPY